jgi:hypothetical protein
MAIRVSGVSVTWGGTSLEEVSDATLALQRDPPASRLPARWSPDMGQITLTAYTRAALPDSDYGQRRRLTITAQNDQGTATSSTFTVFDADCVYLGPEIRAELNKAWGFDHVFKVMDTRDSTNAYPA